jgi:protein-L-isoaspartate(D-aspartate) O-methyltransferase
MVERHLRARGIADERVLEAMGSVPREEFVPERFRRRAYADSALPIGGGQTISQPWIVAAICQALRLRGDEEVLEVGTGSGYSAAVLARLAESVVTIERDAALAAGAEAALAQADIKGVEVVVGDGSLGLPERAPYDAIAVHAAAPRPPATLLAQLSPAGTLVAPIAVAGGPGESLLAFTSSPEGGFERRLIAPARFVPLIGAEGYEPG